MQLVGSLSNSHAVGATVKLETTSIKGDGKPLTLMRELNSASHESDWWGTRDDRLIFGLGASGVPTKLTIRWPRGGNEQVVRDLEQYTNTLMRVTE